MLLSTLVEQLSSFDGKIAEIKESILNSGGIEFRALSSTVENLTGQFEHLQNRLIKANTELVLTQKKLNNSTKAPELQLQLNKTKEELEVHRNQMQAPYTLNRSG